MEILVDIDLYFFKIMAYVTPSYFHWPQSTQEQINAISVQLLQCLPVSSKVLCFQFILCEGLVI